jgi:hypothetical protein
MMNERIARLRAHQRNIDRYEGLLRSTLSTMELRFVEQRLSEGAAGTRRPVCRASSKPFFFISR